MRRSASYITGLASSGASPWDALRYFTMDRASGGSERHAVHQDHSLQRFLPAFGRRPLPGNALHVALLVAVWQVPHFAITSGSVTGMPSSLALDWAKTAVADTRQQKRESAECTLAV